MSHEQKVALVSEVAETYPVGIALSAVELPRSTWYYHQAADRSYTAKHADLYEPLQEIARRRPEYGYRRSTPELLEAHGIRVNDKVIRRLNQLWGLKLAHHSRRRKKSELYQAILAAGEQANLGFR